MKKTLRALPVAVLAAGILIIPAAAHAATTTVRPGDQLYSQVDANTSAQCTANFVYTNGTDTYIGLAAHCFPTPATKDTDTNGCTAPTQPANPAVQDVNGNVIGHRAYSSWVTMQSAPFDVTSEQCQFNDLALVKLDPGVTASPSVPTWGGPNGTAANGGAETGRKVYTYGNSSLRQGITALSPKTGTGIEDSPGGWEHYVQTPNPGIPGDSGSGFMDDHGRAFGVLSTLSLSVPGGVANGVGDMPMELAYANTNGGLGTISVVNGATFNPNATVTASLGV